jgi:hypothetical protein
MATCPNEELLEALRRESLRIAALQPKAWDGDVPSFVYRTEGGMGLGQIVTSQPGGLEWDAYDLQRTEGNGALKIGHFQGEKEAKHYVEMYWSFAS